MKKHNFSAGPAILPPSVLEEAAEAACDFNGSGLSILEISHRSSAFTSVMDEARALTAELLGLGDDFHVLFLTGGASSQFFMVPLNLLHSTERAGYIDTGSWSSKAIKEAKRYGHIETIAGSKDQNYNYIPKNYDLPSDLKYVHLTSNNTIFGTQYHWWPETDIPFVCDMSSDIFSRPIDVDRYDLIYAGAQKNLGPAGTTLAILRKSLRLNQERDIPTMLSYKTHISKGSMFNTPPVFPIYVCLLTLRWLQKNGGVQAMAQANEAKGKRLYDEIDRNACFVGSAAAEDRSLMNVCFLLNDERLNDTFLSRCADAGCVGLKGHRSVGGFRASIYNAMPMDSIDVLIEVMQSLERDHG